MLHFCYRLFTNNLCYKLKKKKLVTRRHNLCYKLHAMLSISYITIRQELNIPSDITDRDNMDEPLSQKFRNEKLYHIWYDKKRRCENENDPTYGGRGIKMLPAWSNDYLAFKRWATQTGYTETVDSVQLVRIDKNGDFKPTNCHLVMKHHRTVDSRKMIVQYKGEQRPLRDLCREHNVNYNMVYRRLKRGWDINKALTEPRHKYDHVNILSDEEDGDDQ